uniref:Immunoglobulin domain-containing protein n=1 Tax=Cyprinus carpio TaxID=7962 RepID=A0A8C1WNM8_CYPCA
MWSQATESLTNTAVTLGADVIISCDLCIEEIYWYKQKSPDPPEFILRTYDSTYEGAEYENSIFKLKYSVKTNSCLFIRNITADELGVYYCVKTSEPLKFSKGTKIYITDFVHKNQTDLVPRDQKPWLIVTIITSVLSVFVIFAVIGLIKSCTNSSRGRKESIRRDVKELQVRTDYHHLTHSLLFLNPVIGLYDYDNSLTLICAHIWSYFVCLSWFLSQFAEVILLKHLSGSSSCLTVCSFSLLQFDKELHKLKQRT